MQFVCRRAQGADFHRLEKVGSSARAITKIPAHWNCRARYDATLFFLVILLFSSLFLVLAWIGIAETLSLVLSFAIYNILIFVDHFNPIRNTKLLSVLFGFLSCYTRHNVKQMVYPKQRKKTFSKPYNIITSYY